MLWKKCFGLTSGLDVKSTWNGKPFENIHVEVDCPWSDGNKRNPNSVRCQHAAPECIDCWSVCVAVSIMYFPLLEPLSAVHEIECHPYNRNWSPEMPNSKCSTFPVHSVWCAVGKWPTKYTQFFRFVIKLTTNHIIDGNNFTSIACPSECVIEYGICKFGIRLQEVNTFTQILKK